MLKIASGKTARNSITRKLISPTLISVVFIFPSALSLHVLNDCPLVSRRAVHDTKIDRDKYMFHQANVVPSSDLGNKSSLEYWYEKIMAALSSYISFPVKVSDSLGTTVISVFILLSVKLMAPIVRVTTSRLRDGRSVHGHCASPE